MRRGTTFRSGPAPVHSRGAVDETFTRDQTWERNSVIMEWEMGEMGLDFYEITEAGAEEIIERFRARGATADQ